VQSHELSPSILKAATHLEFECPSGRGA
jgi:hypothetical protein